MIEASRARVREVATDVVRALLVHAPPVYRRAFAACYAPFVAFYAPFVPFIGFDRLLLG